jgi:predicted phosphate transport protein (TIGR00153 family)
MLFKFFPEEFSFFDLFDEQIKHATEAAALFKREAANGNLNAAVAERMRQIEHSGDEAAHTIIDRLNRTFITPFDREDIYTLAKELDDVTDMLNTITRRMVVYKLNPANKNMAQFAEMIDQSVRTLATCVQGLRNHKDSKAVLAACVEVHRLENIGDAHRDAVLAELFETEKDPIAVIKWKEVYEDAETVLDICEDVANVVESILVKQA